MKINIEAIKRTDSDHHYSTQPRILIQRRLTEYDRVFGEASKR